MISTETYKMDIIIENVRDEKAKALFYHMLINHEIYKAMSEELDYNMKKLNYYNFARTQICGMNDGILGDKKYIEYQAVYELKVIGNLIVLITSAHRIITCIKQARSCEKSADWKTIKGDIESCDKVFDNKLRNFIEHLEEEIYTKNLTNDNCRFSRDRVLYCKDEKIDREFDFNNDQLRIIDNLIDNVMNMLLTRKQEAYKGIT